MAGGPQRKPPYPAVATAASARLGVMPGVLPALLNATGTMAAKLSPMMRRAGKTIQGLPMINSALSAQAAINDP